MKLCVIACVALWKSAATAHIPADLWPLKRYGTCAQFCVYLFEVTHKKDRLEPLSSIVNLTTEVSNYTPNCLDSLSRVLKLSTVESKRTVAR